MKKTLHCQWYRVLFCWRLHHRNHAKFVKGSMCAGPGPFAGLPDEVLSLVMGFLNEWNDIVGSARVCKRWCLVTQDEQTWQLRVSRSAMNHVGGHVVYPAMPTAIVRGVPPSWKWAFQALNTVFDAPMTDDVTGVGHYRVDNECSNMYYSGDFERGRFHGFGVQIRPGFIHYGSFDHGIPEGEGLRMTRGATYAGSFAAGMLHGVGIMTFANGDKIHGKWHCSVCVSGAYTFAATRNHYSGECQQYTPHGKGTFQWRDGRSYTGEWKEGRKHGAGAYHWADGSVYTGNFAHGRREGKGEMSWVDGSVYDGVWRADRRVLDAPEGSGDFANGTRPFDEYFWLEGEEWSLKFGVGRIASS